MVLIIGDSDDEAFSDDDELGHEDVALLPAHAAAPLADGRDVREAQARARAAEVANLDHQARERLAAEIGWRAVEGEDDPSVAVGMEGLMAGIRGKSDHLPSEKGNLPGNLGRSKTTRQYVDGQPPMDGDLEDNDAAEPPPAPPARVLGWVQGPPRTGEFDQICEGQLLRFRFCPKTNSATPLGVVQVTLGDVSVPSLYAPRGAATSHPGRAGDSTRSGVPDRRAPAGPPGTAAANTQELNPTEAIAAAMYANANVSNVGVQLQLKAKRLEAQQRAAKTDWEMGPSEYLRMLLLRTHGGDHEVKTPLEMSGATPPSSSSAARQHMSVVVKALGDPSQMCQSLGINFPVTHDIIAATETCKFGWYGLCPDKFASLPEADRTIMEDPTGVACPHIYIGIPRRHAHDGGLRGQAQVHPAGSEVT